MTLDMSTVIDLDRYPLDDLDRPAGKALAERSREVFNRTSLVILDGFLRSDAVQKAAEQVMTDDESQSFRFAGSNDVFLGTDSETDGTKEGRDGLQRTYTKRTLPHDRIRPDSPVRALYDWRPLLEFVRTVVGGPAYRSVDPLGATTVHIHHGGDEQDWHFDVSEYTLVLHILAPQEGGVLEYVPRSRDAVEQDPEALAEIVRGGRETPTERLPTIPGTAVLHAGRQSMHRVTPVAGPTPRISATISFNSTPNTGLNEYTRRLYFGRNE